MILRRDFLRILGAMPAGALVTNVEAIETEASAKRIFHLSISPQGLDANPDRLRIVREAGVTDVWVGAFLHGHWSTSFEHLQECLKRIEKAGMRAHIINVPLGHPGSPSSASNTTSPEQATGKTWRPGVHPDGSLFYGTSLHPPATQENIRALRQLQAIGVRRAFLDDDFRLAVFPGHIGGCFCDWHRRRFLQASGYNKKQWEQLLDDVLRRSLTSILRAWIEFTCDELTASFRAQQSGSPEIRLGNMVMYLGAEKAGIRLTDYRNAPLRVGELMFNDASFGSVKNKTAELFSSLFHRRFVSPGLAYSETTAYPEDQLSARNMAAKLVVSTLSDVRNTMFMSGMTPFPLSHWSVLAPAMKKQTAIHAQILGHKARGPFKHYWGEASRYIGDDQPYSLFLATGIPFEVTEAPACDGWTFLSDFDARAAAAKQLRSKGTTFVCRPNAQVSLEKGRAVSEDLNTLFALKRKLIPQLQAAPYVQEEKPVVCAWYPTARAVLLWNLSEQQESLTVKLRDTRRRVMVDGLDTVLVSEIG